MPPPNNILIYRLGSLGDTVTALPCFHLIRKTYPHSRINVLTNEPVSGKAAPAMVILENSGLCDEAISYPVGTRSSEELSKIRKTIRKLQPQVALQLGGRAGGGLRASVTRFFSCTCGVRNIIGTPWQLTGFCDPVHVRRRMRTRSDEGWPPGSLQLEPPIDPGGSAPVGLEIDPCGEKSRFGIDTCKREKLFGGEHAGTKVPVKDWGEGNWEKLLALLSEKCREPP